jgi:cbb3-type cytochrome oxidase cytochrome c subunit
MAGYVPYPFEKAVRSTKGPERSALETRRAKTTGQTGIMRTRERLNWQRKHLDQARKTHKQSMDAAGKYFLEKRKAEQNLNAIRNRIKSASPAQKEAMKKALSNAVKKAKASSNAHKIWKKRVGKAAEEIKKVQQSIEKNTRKLNAKLSAKASKTTGKKRVKK